LADIGFLNDCIRNLEKNKEGLEKICSELGIKLEKKKRKINTKQFSTDAKSLKELKVAAVMDEFTKESYAPECSLLELTPQGWREEIDSFKPQLIFIESAWLGKDKLWYRKISSGSPEYFEMTSYCKQLNIPIVFWNKEDPVYTDTFMLAARMADFVFTTDIDCIEKYKKNLKHDNVYFLHFAAQPKLHNPIEKYDRKDKYCFAGAYYHRYELRCRVFDDFAKYFIETKGYDIYDRNYMHALPEHKFPEMYDKYILGRLEPTDIDKAYKGYNYGVNMNSIEQSQSMFARRVFEMLASNTITLGNYSRGVKNLFGDLTISTNDQNTLKECLEKWCGDIESMRKYRLLGLRKVLSEDLYEDRLDFIVQKVFGKSMKKEMPCVNVFSYAENAEDKSYIKKVFDTQTYKNKKLVFLDKTQLVPEFEENSWAGFFDARNHYGNNYVLDLMLSLRYGDYSGIGKTDYYKAENGNITITKRCDTYKNAAALKACRAVFKSELIRGKNFDEIANGEIKAEGLFCADEFNFCENMKETVCNKTDDIEIADKGVGLEYLEKAAENTADIVSGGAVILTGDELYAYAKENQTAVKISLAGTKMIITSSLNDDETYYLNTGSLFEVGNFEDDGKLIIKFDGMGSLDVTGTCLFYDSDEKKISMAFTKLNRSLCADVPKDAEYFRLSLRIKGKGTFNISNIAVGRENTSEQLSTFISRSNVIVLTNQYPSSERLYRNMFVHKRLKAYKSAGLVCDVMHMNIYADDCYREFEGINIVEGHGEKLSSMLENGSIDTVCVHFLDRQMWEILKGFKDRIRIIVWVHGAEIQPWWRRKYNYTNDDDLRQAKADSETRTAFWKEVFDNADGMDIHFIFVSKYFADMVFEDYKPELDKSKYSIIHNCIDTDMFVYRKKDIGQRKKIISIRPYSSNIYANDLSVKTVQELSKRKIFGDLSFKFIGDGDLFDSTLRPLKKFSNVETEKGFIRQTEIARLYAENGILLIPTRGDTQGVSRDEAMSCGLVPVTNAVAAIPEFTDESCAVLACGDDFMAMADGIERLYNEPELFEKMSENAAARVRKQTSRQFTIDKELLLIEGKEN